MSLVEIATQTANAISLKDIEPYATAFAAFLSAWGAMKSRVSRLEKDRGTDADTHAKELARVEALVQTCRTDWRSEAAKHADGGASMRLWLENKFNEQTISVAEQNRMLVQILTEQSASRVEIKKHNEEIDKLRVAHHLVANKLAIIEGRASREPDPPSDRG